MTIVLFNRLKYKKDYNIFISHQNVKRPNENSSQKQLNIVGKVRFTHQFRS